jgi:prepilin-type N-terminal cleavage/methylation domain-containing protein
MAYSKSGIQTCLSVHTQNTDPKCIRGEGGPRGFTLVEVMVAVFIAAILAAAAVAAMSSFRAKYALDAATRLIWSDLQNAKAAAVKTNQSVTVTRSTGTQYGYSYTDGSGIGHTLSRDLANDYPGTTVSLTGNAVTFSFRGTAGNPGDADKTVMVQNSSGTKSFAVKWTGNIQSVQ